MYSLSLNNTNLDFKTIEKIIDKTVCDIACNCLNPADFNTINGEEHLKA